MAQTNYDKMVADLDEGYARLSNLLLESFALAPLKGPDFRVLQFIIRRTYGYSTRHNDPKYKMDQMYYADIARGTDMSQRTVEGVVQKLKALQVIVVERKSDSNKTAYGINTRIHEWGDGSAIWDKFHSSLINARANDFFKRGKCDQTTGQTAVNSTSSIHRNAKDGLRQSTETSPLNNGDKSTPVHGDVTANSRRCHRRTAETSPPVDGDSGAFKPTATGAKGALTERFTERFTDSITERIASPVGEAHQTALEVGSEHTPKTAPVIRAQSPQQKVGDATLNMFRLTHDSLSKEQCAKYYKAIASVIKSTYLGAEGILEWIAKQPQQTLGEGSDPAICIPAYLRSNLQTHQKHLEFARERQQRQADNGYGPQSQQQQQPEGYDRNADILAYWKIRALEDLNEKDVTGDRNNVRSRLAEKRLAIVQRLGSEPDFSTRPKVASA